MERPTTPWVGSVVLVVAVVAVVAAIARRGADDVTFCQAVLKGLANANQAIQRKVDWERLKAMGVDVGATYTKLANERERSGYRRAFINSFSENFYRARGDLEAFRRWRVEERADGRIVVAADYEGRHRTLLLSLPASGRKQVVEIQWQ